MKKMVNMKLAEWAAVAEILGMIAVIISLLLVVSSIRQNTAVMHTTNDNFLYERQDAIITTLVTDPSMAELYIKHQNNEQLSEVEHVRLWNQLFRDMLMWELAFNRFEAGLLSAAQWQEWDKAYSLQFLSEFPPSWWQRLDLGSVMVSPNMLVRFMQRLLINVNSHNWVSTSGRKRLLTLRKSMPDEWLLCFAKRTVAQCKWL